MTLARTTAATLLAWVLTDLTRGAEDWPAWDFGVLMALNFVAMSIILYKGERE